MPKVVLKDHYVVLGVPRNATSDAIKRQYRKRARETHPDLLGPDVPEAERREANELFGELALAYAQLMDPETRDIIGLWLTSPGRFDAGTEDFDNFDVFNDEATYREPEKVPTAGQHLLNGIWCWVEFFRPSGWYGLRAIVTVQLADLFKAVDLWELPDGAWLEEVIALDEKGGVVGRGYSLASLRYNIRRLEAEARRNTDRRAWRLQLDRIEWRLGELAELNKPVGRLRTLLVEARRCVESGAGSLRGAEQRDTVVRAIREAEKEIERVTSSESAELLLNDLLSGKVRHPDLGYNEVLLEKLRIYGFRSGGAYSAPGPEAVREHYCSRLAGLTDHDQLYGTDLKLTDDEPTIQELAAEGALELAPDTISVQGNRGLTAYEVRYGFARVEGQLVPAGMIVVPESVYERNGAQYGRVSQFPTLPYGIVLLIRVRVKIRDGEVLSDPRPDGKALLNEVSRCRAQLRNPKEPAEPHITWYGA